MKCNDDSVELSRYEKGIKNLIDTFVNSSEGPEVVKPVSIGDKKSMDELLKSMDSNEARERKGGVAQCVGKSAMSRERDDDAERGRERSKRAKKRHGDRALVCFPICCCASAMSFCASVAVYISCASAGGVKPLPLTSRALVMKVKAIGSHSWMMRLTVLICLRLTTHTSTLCSSPV